jgi:hypothetical protein
MAQPLPSVEQDSPPLMHELPQILPRFYIPPLPDKPQNPIMDGLRFVSRNYLVSTPSIWPAELVIMAEDLSMAPVPKSSDTLWADAVKRADRCQVRLVGLAKIPPISDQIVGSNNVMGYFPSYM